MKINKKLERFCSFQIREIDKENRTIDLSFSSEEPVERWFGYEILDHSPEAVKMERLLSGAPLLLDHDRQIQIGVIESARIGDDRKGHAKVRFSKSDKGQEILDDVEDEIRRSISVGYMIHELILEKEEKDGPSTYRATRWEPMEISIVSVPADITVGVGRSKPDDKELIDIPLIQTREKIVMEEPIVEKKVETTPPVKPKVEVSADDIKDARTKAAADARAILAMGRKFDMMDEADLAIDKGMSVDQFRELVISKMDKTQVIVSRDDNKLGLTSGQISDFSIKRAMFALMENPGGWHKDAPKEYELSRAAQEKAGREVLSNRLTIPLDILLGKAEAVREITASSGGTGLVGTDHLASNFIEMLRNKAVLTRVGARMLTGLVGNVSIPKQTGATTAYWVADSGDVTASDTVFGAVTLSPKTVGAAQLISRRLLLQSDPSVEALILNDLASVVALAIDYAGIAGTGSSNQPTGVINQSGVGSVNGASIGWEGVVEFETDVSEANADIGNLAYICRPSVRGILKTREKASGTAQFLMSGGEMNGYPVDVSMQTPVQTLIFGAWSQLLIGMWGGLDILVDRFTSAADGGMYIWAYQDVDIAVRHAGGFSVSDDIS